MRVYGSTPLYNYVELIFRSKRLFTVSIILASMVTAALAMLRQNSYSATATILLTGTQETGPQQLNEEQRGSVQYKLDVLNLALKDPSFIRDFLSDAGLDKGMSPDQFATYAEDVKKSLSYNTGDNILEITCKWHGTQCEDIVTAFYSAYKRHVLQMETVISTSQTRLLETLRDDFDRRQQKLDARIAAWQKLHVNNFLVAPEEIDREVGQQKQTVQSFQLQLEQSNQKLAMIQGILANTKQTITEQTIREAQPTSPESLSLKNRIEVLTHKLSDLRQKYTDVHPDVVKTQTELNQALEKQKEMNDILQSANGSHVSQRKDIANPRYQELQFQVDEERIGVNTIKNQLDNAKKQLATLTDQAGRAPQEVVEYDDIVKDKEVIAANRANLASKLEAAKMEQKRDLDLHTQEMALMISPKAEPELVGAKSFIFYFAGPLLGIIIAFGVSLVSETMDPTLRTPLEVEKYLNKPVLAVLPTIRPDRKVSRRLLSTTDATQELPPGTS